ncbi:ribosomal protein HS6-type [Enterocytozoon bieneusi H348]|nr:ribosomal protein HS6-type [Enterocytozoon bieneusi H348]|eukprot:XP_001828103.1 ribosomal protein HS6-type [Enterocytozoon bieneusi H348]
MINKIVSQPTKYILLNTQFQNHKNYKLNITIDFYQLNNTQVIDATWESQFKHLLINDTRIKNVYQKQWYILIEFWSISEGITFYKQFYKSFEMKFIDEYCFNVTQTLQHYTVIKTYITSNCIHNNLDTNKIYNINQLLNFKINVNCKDNYDITPYHSSIYTEANFKKRVNYFNGLKNLYSKDDTKKLKILINRGNRDMLLANIKELCVGIFTNILLQYELTQMSEYDLFNVINHLNYDIVPISATKYGAYVIQKLIDNTKSFKNQELLCKYFALNGRYLIFHTIGNYSIQQLLIFNNDKIKELFIDELYRIIEHSIGYKVFLKSIKYFTSYQTEIYNKLNVLNKVDKKSKLIINLLNKYYI